MARFYSRRVRRQLLSLLFIFILHIALAGALLTSLLPTVRAQPYTHLAVNPSATPSMDGAILTANPGEYILIGVNVINVTDLYSFGLRISWKPAGLMNLDMIAEGGFLKKDGGQTDFDYIAGSDYVDVTNTLLFDVPGVSGDGNLVLMRFQVDDTGNSTLPLKNTSLIKKGAVPIEHDTVDGIFYTTYPKAKAVEELPYLNFFYIPNPSQYGHPIVGETITFNGSACYDPDDTNPPGAPHDPTPGGIVSWAWDFGDGNVTTVTDPIITHSYATNGTYQTSLTITDDDGETDTELRSITINAHDLTILNVTTTPSTVIRGDVVNIDVKVKNNGMVTEYFNVTAYYDGNFANTSRFRYWEPYPREEWLYYLEEGDTKTTTLTWNTTGVAPGTYAITVNMTYLDQKTLEPVYGLDQNETDNTFTDGTVLVAYHDVAVTGVTLSNNTVTITGSGQETVSISVTVANEGNVEETFDVTAYYDGVSLGTQTTTLAGGAVTTLLFQFNATLAGEGNYTIKAEASEVPYEYDTVDNIYIDGNINVTRSLGVPVANFTYSPENPRITELVTFNATLSYDPDGTIVRYSWDFGDGTTEIYVGANLTAVTTHAYPQDGDYVVTLLVEDNSGLLSGKQKMITVADYPVANFTYSPEKPKVDELMTFDASSSTPNGGTIVSWEWDFGDETNGTGKTITHTYATFGIYTVTLTITDSEGLSDSIEKETKIYAPPVSNFTYLPSNPMKRESITFNATLSYDPDGNIVAYSWDFDDGTTEIYVGANLTAIATHIYTERADFEDTYSVVLNVTDSDGLITGFTKSIKVLRPYDIAIANITSSAYTAMIGDILSINVTAQNKGSEPVVTVDPRTHFNVTVYFDNTFVGTQEVTALSFGASQELTFSLNTANMDAGIYKIRAVAETNTVGGTQKRDFNTTNNNLVSAPIAIQASSTISISASPQNTTLGESVTINGIVTPKPVAQTSAEIHYRIIGETAWNTTTVEINLATGQYEYIWTPSMVGTYEIKASWPGDLITQGAESAITTVTVEEAPGPPLDIIIYGVIAAALVGAGLAAFYFFGVRKKP